MNTHRNYNKKAPIELPHAWDPYPWQEDVLAAMQKGIKRFLLLVHRRAGKDQVALNMAAIASQDRIGQYWHVMPYASQCRKHIWLGADKDSGVRFIDQAFPHELRVATRNNQMEIEMSNGSIFTLIGSDNYEALRSGNPIFVAFSEAAFANQSAWSRMAPILRENDGIVAFITTPMGCNWIHKLYNAVKDNENWYVRVLTVEDTLRQDGTPIISQAKIEAERAEGQDEATILREYYCDFNASIAGAYYINELAGMKKESRITKVDYNSKRTVICAFDLGYSDLMVALFFQKKGNAHYLIASREWHYTEMQDALDEIQVIYPWKVDKYILPHDASSRTTRNLLLSAFEPYGETEIIDRTSVHIGIQAVRSMMSTLWIDDQRHDWGDNSQLIDAVGTYRSKQNKDGRASATPVHDWSSHYMDALRYYALADAWGLTSAAGWGKSPDYKVMDMITRTI